MIQEKNLKTLISVGKKIGLDTSEMKAKLLKLKSKRKEKEEKNLQSSKILEH